MARPKIKNAKQINFSLDEKLINEFKEYCNDLGQSQTVAIERIIKKAIDEHNSINKGFSSQEK